MTQKCGISCEKLESTLKPGRGVPQAQAWTPMYDWDRRATSIGSGTAVIPPLCHCGDGSLACAFFMCVHAIQHTSALCYTTSCIGGRALKSACNGTWFA